jgi:hypothetical protein
LQPSASDRLGAVGVYRCGESEVKFCWRDGTPRPGHRFAVQRDFAARSHARKNEAMRQSVELLTGSL